MKQQDAQRRGDWMQTFTGRQFWPLDPRPDEVDIHDIAHSLSLICRYNGHSREHYSVAQHCCLVAMSVSPENRMWALLHDAAEAYLGDMIRPIKRSMPEFERAEELVLCAIAVRFGLTLPIPEEVMLHDIMILNNERIDLLQHCVHPWGTAGVGMLEIKTIKPWDADFAERLFLSMFFGWGGKA